MLNDSDSPRPTALRLWGTPLINEGGEGVCELSDKQGSCFVMSQVHSVALQRDLIGTFLGGAA